MEKTARRRRSRRARAGQPPRRVPPAGARRAGRACRPERSRDALGLAPNTLSFHFDRLRQAGLVTCTRDGRSLIYAARFETMNALLGYLTENCCERRRDDVRPPRARQAAIANAKRRCPHESASQSDVARCRHRRRPRRPRGRRASRHARRTGEALRSGRDRRCPCPRLGACPAVLAVAFQYRYRSRRDPARARLAGAAGRRAADRP